MVSFTRAAALLSRRIVGHRALSLIGTAFRALRLLRMNEADGSTAAGRARERHRRLAWTSLTSALSRIVGISVGLITVPLTFNYLGSERFGVWMALTSFFALLSFADLGMGTGLQNALSACHGRDDRRSTGPLIASAVAVMAVVLTVSMALSVWLLPALPLERAIRVETPVAAGELLATTQVTVIGFALGLAGGVLQRIHNAYQRGYWANLQTVAGSVLGLAGVLLSIRLGAGLPALVGSVLGARFLVAFVGSLVLFTRVPWLRPRFSGVSRQRLAAIVSVGFWALGAQAAGVLLLNAPQVVIANRFGAAEVAPFAIAHRLLGVGGTFFIAAVVALWPAYAEASIRGDWAWIRTTHARSVELWLATSIPMVGVAILAGQWVIGVWTGSAAAVPDIWLIVGSCVWFAGYLWGMTSSTLLSGTGHMQGQTIYGNGIAVGSVALAWVIAPWGGITGVVWTIAVAGAVLRGVAMRYELSALFRRAAQQLAVTPSREARLPLRSA